MIEDSGREGVSLRAFYVLFLVMVETPIHEKADPSFFHTGKEGSA